MVTYIFINHLDHIRKVNCKFRMTEEYQRKNAMEEMQMGITGVGSSYNFVYNTKIR